MNVKNKFHCNQLKLKERSADQQNHYSWRIPVHDTDRLRHVRQCLYMRTTLFSSGEADMTSCTGSGLRNYSFPPLLSCILSGNYTHLGKIRSLSLSLSRSLPVSPIQAHTHIHTHTHTHTHAHTLPFTVLSTRQIVILHLWRLCLPPYHACNAHAHAGKKALRRCRAVYKHSLFILKAHKRHDTHAHSYTRACVHTHKANAGN